MSLRVGLASALLIVAACSNVEPPAANPADIDGDNGQDTAVSDDAKADGPGALPGTQLVLRGDVVTMDEARGTAQVVTGGAVVIAGGKIKAVLGPNDPLPTGTGVTVLPSRTGASDWVISPGLINLHNHLAYDTARMYRDLPLYENTYQWRDENYYDNHIMNPKKLLGASSLDPKELGLPASSKRIQVAGIIGRYAEAKELASGTTSTQGSYFGTTVPQGYASHLVRNLDWSNFGKRRVSQASLGVLVGSFDPRALIKRMDGKEIDAWLVHLLEGTDQESQDEFDCLKAMGLVRKETVIIHGTALSEAQLKEMARVGAKIVASPLDNLLYYGHAVDIRTAWKLGVNVSLGTDWSSAGSKNLLAELKVLDLMNKQVWGSTLADRDMIQMVTTNPADAIGWTGNVGRIKVGLYADLAVYTKKAAGPYRSIIEATEKDVRLVVIGGDALYGDVAMMNLVKKGDNEVVTAGCGFSKAIDMTTTNAAVDGGMMTFAQVKQVLTAGLKWDPAWIAAHWDAARTAGATGATLTKLLKSKFPRGMDAKELDPMFVCDDPDYLDELRTDANIRTSYAGGLCLDLRPWYAGAAAQNCGAMPAHPPLLTTMQHPGTQPERAASWCADQTWTGGVLPKP